MKIVLLIILFSVLGCVTIPANLRSSSSNVDEQFHLYSGGQFHTGDLLGNTYAIFEDDTCSNLSNSKYIPDFVGRLKSDLHKLGLIETDVSKAFLTIAYDCQMKDISKYQDGRTSSIEEKIDSKWTTETDVAGDKVILRQKYFDQVTNLIEGSKKSPLVSFRVTAYKEDEIMSRPIFSMTMGFLDGSTFNTSHWTKGTQEILNEVQVLQGKVPQKSPEIFCSYRLGLEWSPSKKVPPFTIKKIFSESLAEKNGFKIRDQILTVNGVPAVEFYQYGEKTIEAYEKHAPFDFEIRRGDRILKKKITPIKICRKLT